jgi:4-aminobutyrate aminotransferase-like enzyme
VAAIETYRDDGLIDRAASLGERLGARLADLARTRPQIAEVRGLGMLWALELCVPGTRQPLPAPALAKVAATLRAHHLHLHKRDNLVYIAPPLVISAVELEEAVGALGRALDEALA